MLADDIELYRSTDRSSTDSLLTAMQSCVSDVKDWVLVNKLQLNEDKTEAPLLDLQIQKFYQTCVPFADSARNLGVIFDNSLYVYERSGEEGVTKLHFFKILKLEELDLSESILTLDPSLLSCRLLFK